ncbi:unnamed protein product [Clonostachys solani]|uniref:NAD(P)-binding protein n=1 Tax=Clonostachys solani TaxID=160281 RepID=A0A9N9ZJ43_9HYPO|nr:unnamed protein product [Clonostachys solani]
MRLKATRDTGHAVAAVLSDANWVVSLVDSNEIQGQEAAAKIRASFHRADIRDWASLSTAFDQTVHKHGRLDFVFANAGVTDPRMFYDSHSSTPPPEPDFSLLDINLKGTVNTAYLAQHYFRVTRQALQQGVRDYDPSLIFTSSIAALTAIPEVPIYSAAKSGIVAFAHAIAPPFFQKDGIRVSSICPGRVMTPKRLLSGGASQGQIVPMEMVCEAVLALLKQDGGFDRCLKILPDGISDVETPSLNNNKSQELSRSEERDKAHQGQN